MRFLNEIKNRIIIAAAAPLLIMPAAAKTLTFEGVSALDSSNCELSLETADERVLSISGYGFGVVWTLDIFGSCGGVCEEEAVISTTSFGGDDFSDLEALSYFAPVILTRGSDTVVSGSSELTDSTESISIVITDKKIDYKYEVKTGLDTNSVLVGAKEFTCLLKPAY